MPNAFVNKLRGYAPLDRSDVEALEAACQNVRRYPPGYDLIREGDEPSVVFVVLEGWACRYKMLPDGGRQIIAFMMPGDCCDVHVAVLSEMEALTDARHGLTKAFWWTQLVDEGVLRATIVSMGRRTTQERIAHLLCELYFRMRNIGLTDDGPCEMPFTQIVLADAVGLTPVHTNRVIKTLRSAGALEVTPGSLIISDISRLAHIAGFDDNYLHRRSKRSA